MRAHRGIARFIETLSFLDDELRQLDKASIWVIRDLTLINDAKLQQTRRVGEAPFAS